MLAGNSSQTSDGAAAVVLARRSYARRHQLPVLGVLRGFAVTGVPPSVMGIGPAYAIPKALDKAGLNLQDIDIYEINEAFASQAVYCVEVRKSTQFVICSYQSLGRFSMYMYP